MKKALMFLITGLMALSLLSCGGQKTQEAKKPAVEAKTTQAVQDTTAKADTTQQQATTQQKPAEK